MNMEAIKWLDFEIEQNRIHQVTSRDLKQEDHYRRKLEVVITL